MFAVSVNPLDDFMVHVRAMRDLFRTTMGGASTTRLYAPATVVQLMRK